MPTVLTPNFNPKPSGIRVEIYDHSGVLVYTYQGENVSAIKPIASWGLDGDYRDLYGDVRTQGNVPASGEAFMEGIGQQQAADFSNNGWINIFIKTLVGNTATNPTVVETTEKHNLEDGDIVVFEGTNSTPVIDGSAVVVTVIDDTHFSVPISVSVAGTAGTMKYQNPKFEPTTTTPFSVMGRAKPNTIVGTDLLASKTVNVNVDDGWAVWRSTDELLFRIRANSINYQALSISVPPDSFEVGKWTHWACAKGSVTNSDDMDVFIDSDKSTGATLNMPDPFSNFEVLTIGAESDGGFSFDGLMQNIHYYNIKLTQAQVDANRLSQSSYGFVPDLSPPANPFRLTDISLALGANDSYGSCEIMIEDIAGNLIDTTTLRRKSLIKPEFRIQVYLGKDAAGLERWFSGIIKDADVVRPQTNDERIHLTCVGTGLILKERRTLMKVNQDKDSGGLTLDGTDVKTTLYNLLLKLINEQDHQVDENIPLIKAIYAHLNINGIHQETLDIKLANVNELFTSYASFISRMAGIANADWYVNPDDKLIVRDGNVFDSGVLITNDLTSLDAQNWNSKRLSYITNMPFGWKDTSNEGMWSFIHGSGHFKPVLDSSQTGTPDARDSFINEWLAVPITMKRDNIFKIALRLAIDGTPSSSTEIKIVGGDGSGKFAQGSIVLSGTVGGSLDTLTVNGVEILGTAVTVTGSLRATALVIAGKINDHVSVPDYLAYVDEGSKIIIQTRSQSDLSNGFVVAFTKTGAVTVVKHDIGSVFSADEQKGITGRPNFNDVRRSVKLTAKKLQGLEDIDVIGASPAKWLEIPLTPKLDLTPSEQIWILMPNYGTAGNELHFDYKTGSGKFFQSVDGFNWFEVTGEVNYRVYSAKRLTTTVENTKLSKLLPEVRELVIPFRGDMEEETVREVLIQAISIIGQERRYYTDFVCSVPERRIDLASYCKVKDKQTGMEIKAKIAGYELEAHAGQSTQIGVRHIKLALDEAHGS